MLCPGQSHAPVSVGGTCSGHMHSATCAVSASDAAATGEHDEHVSRGLLEFHVKEVTYVYICCVYIVCTYMLYVCIYLLYVYCMYMYVAHVTYCSRMYCRSGTVAVTYADVC